MATCKLCHWPKPSDSSASRYIVYRWSKRPPCLLCMMCSNTLFTRHCLQVLSKGPFCWPTFDGDPNSAGPFWILWHIQGRKQSLLTPPAETAWFMTSECATDFYWLILVRPDIFASAKPNQARRETHRLRQLINWLGPEQMDDGCGSGPKLCILISSWLFAPITGRRLVSCGQQKTWRYDQHRCLLDIFWECLPYWSPFGVLIHCDTVSLELAIARTADHHIRCIIELLSTHCLTVWLYVPTNTYDLLRAPHNQV